VTYDDKSEAALFDHCEIVKSCGLVYPFEKFCIITDRPEIIKIDDGATLHCEDGPAILYRDGYSLFSWRGVRIPGEWIEDKASLTPEIALQWENVEQRRAACEILGWANILSRLDAVTVDKDDDPMVGELIEVTLPDSGREKFLRVLCGTGREFALPVPPEMTTALQANAWTYAIDDLSIFKPEVRT
jgi:hypothetical protein